MSLIDDILARRLGSYKLGVFSAPFMISLSKMTVGIFKHEKAFCLINSFAIGSWLNNCSIHPFGISKHNGYSIVQMVMQLPMRLLFMLKLPNCKKMCALKKVPEKLCSPTKKRKRNYESSVQSALVILGLNERHLADGCLSQLLPYLDLDFRSRLV